MPKDGTATRERILAAAEYLVIENGFAATSLDQVIKASGSSKGAFFHHFDSKRDLARALVWAVRRVGPRPPPRALEATDSRSRIPRARTCVRARLRGRRRRAACPSSRGCLYTSVLTERQLIHDGTADQIEEAIVAWRTAIRRPPARRARAP